MAYRRPAIEVIQEFQEAAAALALPTLPACVVGPGFQVKNDVDAGTYSEDELGPTTYEYPELEVGAIVDLTDVPETEAEANAHKPVTITLRDALLERKGQANTGTLEDPNLFQDGTTGAFATFDPDATGAPTFYVDVISGAGLDDADIGRKLVIGKNSNGELVVAAEWQSALPLNNVTYRILEFRDEEQYGADDLAGNGITAAAGGVTIDPGLATVSDTTPLPVVEANVLLSYRALRPDVASSLNAFTDLDSLEAVFGVGAIVPENIGPYVVNLALNNTTTEVNFTGLSADFFTAEEQAFQSALEFLENKDVYALALCSHTPAVHQLLKSHVAGMSLSTAGRERVGLFNRKLVETEVLVPPSGIGNVTSAGANNGLSGTDNKTFKDPTNGSFVTDDVGVGHYLEIVDYTPVAGIHRSVAPAERDYFDDAPASIQLMNAAFVGGDVGRKIITRASTTADNDAVYSITAIVNAKRVTVNPAPDTAEVMEATTRAWIADLDRAIAHDAADAVVAATKTWSFVGGDFTDADVGKVLFIVNSANGNDGAFLIGQVLSPTQVKTVEAPAANEVFGGTVTQTLYSINREPGRDIAADSVDGASRVWTIRNGDFTADDVARVLHVAGATNGANNAQHTIEAVLSSSQVRTSNATVPVSEEFNGLTTPTLTTLDIRSVTPSPTEEAYIKGTRHKIAAVVSETQFTLGADPTAGFGGTLEDVEYRITRNLTLNEQAEFIAGYATSFGSRRMVHTWPDVLAVSVNGQATKVPGYFAGGPIAGMTAGLPSQAGFTNLTMVGFVGRENSDDKFSDKQLDTIAAGGNMIFTQPVADAALGIRHQLTTDVSTIQFQEYSVTKNLDMITRFFRGHYRPFIGIYNITDGLLDLLKTRGESGITFLLSQRFPRIGAPIRKGQLERIEESTEQPDSVEIDIGCSLPLPLNNLKIKLLV